MPKKQRPKLGIVKKYIIDEDGHYRFYSPNFNPKGDVKKYSKEDRPPMPIWDLEKMDEIQTERELVRRIYETWGEGIYRIFAYLKGRKGPFIFWKGRIDEEGFKFFKQRSKNKEVKEWEDEVREAKLKGEDSEIEEELLEEAKEEARKKKRKKRYGFRPFLKRSSRRGRKAFWSDKDIMKHIEQEQEEEEDWFKKSGIKRNDSDKSYEWNIDEKDKKKDEFEKWKQNDDGEIEVIK